MSRINRVVISGCPHHLVQRGNQRQAVFFSDEDRRTYLTIFREHSRKFQLRTLAWCLMPNHVHVVAIPDRQDSLAWGFGRTNCEYALWLHYRQQLSGHVWQNRFYSCVLEEGHLWEAIRYVELNPVRAGLARHAGDWRWSSAAVHLGAADSWGLLDAAWWRERWQAARWAEVLDAGIRDAAWAERFRESTRTGRPFGGEAFQLHVEAQAGRAVLKRKPGPKPKAAAAAAGAAATGFVEFGG